MSERSILPTLPTLPIAIALAIPSLVAAQGEGDKSAEYLDKMEAVCQGDSDVRGAVNTIARGRCSIELAAGPDRGAPMAGEFVDYYAADGRSSVQGSFGKGMSFRSGFDGKTMWEFDPGEGLKLITGTQLIDRARVNRLITGVNWRELYKKSEVIAKKDVDGRPHVVIRMTPKTGTQEKWWIATDKWNLTRIEMPWNNLDVTVYFSNFKRAKNGILHAWKRMVVFDFATIAYELKEIETGMKIEDSVFALPDEVRKLVKESKAGGRATNESSFVVRNMQEQHTAMIRIPVKPADMGKALSTLLPEIYSVLNQNKINPIGPPYTRYHKFGRDEIDLEAGFPVAAAIEASGRTKPGKLPACKAVTTWHIGHYHGLQKTYQQLGKWVEENRYELASPQWEVYWTDPGKVEDPAKWRTHVIWPIRAKVAEKGDGKRPADGEEAAKKTGK